MGFFIGESRMDTKPLTLQELLLLALPAETRVLAGHLHLDCLVSWIVSASASDRSARLAAGDLLFLLPPYSPDLASRLPEIAHTGVAGVVLLGEPGTAVVESAVKVGVPLLALPDTADTRAIERTSLTLLLDRTASMEQRAARLYQALTILSAENAGLEAMAALIGSSTGKMVLIQDKRLSLIAMWFAEPAPERAAVEAWVSDPANLPEDLRDRKRAAQSHDISEQPLANEKLTRLIAPIIAKGMARGFLSLVGDTGTFGMSERSVAEQCAAACALEMAKAKAVSEAEKRVRGSFVDAILTGNLSPLEATRWARRNKYDPDGRHAAIVADWVKKEHPTYRRLETLVHGLIGSFPTGVLTQARENEMVIFGRLEPRQGIETARHIAENIRRQASAEFPNDPLGIGIGRPVDALIGLRDSYREARQALSMARRLAEPNPLYFGDLNVYRLLFQLEYSPDLASFCQETIGKLIEYDRAQGTDLIETLSSYFAHKSNLSQTAEALFVHRNTLLYRMERIREISGLDLDNPETRLSIQLALRANRLLTAREE
jgi:purine catabolism regulator